MTKKIFLFRSKRTYANCSSTEKPKVKQLWLSFALEKKSNWLALSDTFFSSLVLSQCRSRKVVHSPFFSISLFRSASSSSVFSLFSSCRVWFVFEGTVLFVFITFCKLSFLIYKQFPCLNSISIFSLLLSVEQLCWTVNFQLRWHLLSSLLFFVSSSILSTTEDKMRNEIV